MPALIQICIVIVTVGLLAIAMMTLRMMTRFNKAFAIGAIVGAGRKAFKQSQQNSDKPLPASRTVVKG